MNIKYKLVGLVALVVLIAPGVSMAQAQSVSSLQAQIAALLAEVQTLQAQLTAVGGSGTSGTRWCYTFSSNLSIGMTSSAVSALQTALQKDGESVTVTGTFDDQTASAVTGFQEKYAAEILTPNGLSNGTGYAGASTRAELNTLFGCTGNPINPRPIGPEPIVPVPPIAVNNAPIITEVSAAGANPTPGNSTFISGYYLPTQDATIVIDPGSPSAEIITSGIYYNVGGGGSMSFTVPSNVSPGSHTIEIQANGVVSNVFTFTVISAPSSAVPNVAISVYPGVIVAGQSATLYWSSTNATSCTAAGANDWSGSVATSGSQTITPTNDPALLPYVISYQITCAGPGGSGTVATKMTVTAPSAALSITPTGQSSAVLTNSTGSLLATFYITSPVVATLNSVLVQANSNVGPGQLTLANLRVYVTTQANAEKGIEPTQWYGVTQAVVFPNNTYSFSGSYVMAANTTEEIEVFGDTVSAIPGGYASPLSIAGATATNAPLQSFTTVPGGNVTVELPLTTTFTASANAVSSGNSVTFSWTNAIADQGSVNAFITQSCVSGLTMYDVTNNESFKCGDVDRQVLASGSDTITFTNTSGSPIATTFALDYGSGQFLYQTITVSPAANSNPTITVSPVTVSSGNTATVSWSGTRANDDLIMSCPSGVTIYDVGNNQNFPCGDVQRYVASSGSYDLKFTNANNSPANMTAQLSYTQGTQGVIETWANLTVNAGASPSGALSLSQPSFSATYLEGTSLPNVTSSSFAQVITLTNTSNSNITYTISIPNQPAWLNGSYNKNPLPLNAGQQAGLGVYLDPTTVAKQPGTYSTSITITGNFSGSPAMIPLTLKVIQ